MENSMVYSGIEWIGNIPSEWSVEKVKQGFIRKNEKAQQENPVVLSLARTGVKVRDLSNNEGQMAESYYNYNPVEEGDLLLNPMDLISGANCSYSRVNGVISPAYINLSAKEGYDPIYYDYYFKVQYWLKAFFAHGKGVSFDNRWTLSVDSLLNYPIIKPDYETQKKIAVFLDEECRHIEEVIDKTKKSIEEYKKLKQIVITQAVTKGLQVNRKMKETGIEWIGSIPDNWEIIPFKYILHERAEKNNPVKTSERLSLSIDLGVTLYSEKTTNLDRFKEDVSQYKLAHEGDLVMNSMNMIVGAVGVSNYFGCVSPAYYTYYDELPEHETSRYCDYLFRSKTIRGVLHSLGRGIMSIERGDDRINTCRLKVSREDLRSLKLPLPPIDEQKEIIKYLDNKSQEIDELIRRKEDLLIEIENYRRSLIFEFVTGKKKVV